MAKPKLKTKPVYGPPAPEELQPAQPELAPPVDPVRANLGVIGKPMVPATPLPAAPPAPAPIGQPIMGKMALAGGPPPSAVGDVQPPDLAPNPSPSISSIGTPIQPAAPKPVGSRLAQLQEQGAPQYHGLKRVADTLAGATTIGTAIERSGGIGTQGYQANLERAGYQAGLENEQQKAADTSQKSQADTEQSLAAAHHSDVSADVAQQNAESVMVTLPDGRSVSVPAKDKAGVIKSLEGIKSREGIAQEQISARQAPQDGKPISIDELVSQAIQDNDQATLQKVQAYKTAIAKAGASQPGSYMPVNDAAGNTVGWVNPKAEPTKQYIPVGSIPGVGAAAGGNSGGAPAIPPKPTAATLTMAQMAGTVEDVQPAVMAQIDAVQQKIGPAIGRWKELWVNGAGMNDPEFAKLDTMLDLYASAVVRTHFGARGGMQYREELKKMFSEAQTVDDLRARISGADAFISRYAHPSTKTVPPAGQPSGDQPPAAQPGMKVQKRVVNGKTEYRQVPVAAN